MFSLSSSDRYLLYQGDCDMRRGAYSLSGLVRNELGRSPLNGDVFVFLNRSRTCIKLLRWESGGFVLFIKYLEKGTYNRPVESRTDGALSWAELVLMIENISSTVPLVGNDPLMKDKRVFDSSEHVYTLFNALKELNMANRELKSKLLKLEEWKQAVSGRLVENKVREVSAVLINK